MKIVNNRRIFFSPYVYDLDRKRWQWKRWRKKLVPICYSYAFLDWDFLILWLTFFFFNERTLNNLIKVDAWNKNKIEKIFTSFISCLFNFQLREISNKFSLCLNSLNIHNNVCVSSFSIHLYFHFFVFFFFTLEWI